MLVTDLRATRRRLSELVGSIDATVEATPAFPLAGPGGKPFDPWADSPAGTQAPHPPAPVQVPEPAEASSVQPPQPVHVPEPVEGPVAEAPDHVDPFAGLDPFAPPPSEAGLFDDFATGPSYEGAGTGEPLFDDPDLRPRSYGDVERPAGYGTNGFQAGGIGHAEYGEPASFELPAGENLDLGQYAEDEPEVTPTIELSLPDIPSFAAPSQRRLTG